MTAGTAAQPQQPRAWPFAVRQFRFWLTNYKRTWRGTIYSSLLNPVLYLGAMGLGLGTLEAVEGLGHHLAEALGSGGAGGAGGGGGGGVAGRNGAGRPGAARPADLAGGREGRGRGQLRGGARDRGDGHRQRPIESACW